MKLTPAQQEFAARLGHEFADPELLSEALTHASISGPTRRDNQRLEFLGDRVLGLVIAEVLLSDDGEAAEGTLAPRLNALVRKETCAAIAAKMDLGAALAMGKSEMATGGRRKLALLGDAMEAVIAAVYLDAGYGAARDLILRHWRASIASVEDHARDPKTALQEWAQARGHPPPDYVEVDRAGPDHAPKFTIEVTVGSGESARAEAASKRAAQQMAAEALLGQLESET